MPSLSSLNGTSAYMSVTFSNVVQDVKMRKRSRGQYYGYTLKSKISCFTGTRLSRSHMKIMVAVHFLMY